MKTLRFVGLLLVCAGCSLALSTDEYREPVGDAGSDVRDPSDSSLPDAGGDTNDPSDTGSDSPTFDGCTPMPETCNGVSDDCDVTVDEDTCDFPNTSASCEPGGCEVVSCDVGFLDCSAGMGCETAEDRNNCGECGIACGATQQCESGICVEPTLDWSWTIDEGANDFGAYISNGLDQSYLLTIPAISGSAPLVVNPSTGAPFSVSVAGRDHGLLVAMNDAGEEVWRVRLSAQRLRTAAARSIEGLDGVFIAGDFQGTLNAEGPLGDLTMTSGANADGFVLQIDASGTIRRVAQLTDRAGGDEYQTITDMAVAPDGTVFVLGTSRGDFATGLGGSSVFDTVPSGAFRFLLRVERFRGNAVPLPSSWESIAVDDTNVYIGTRVEGTVTIGGTEYSDSRFSPLVVAYDHELVFRWAQAHLAPGDGQGEDEEMRLYAGNGTLFLSHTFDEPHSFGGQAVDAGGFVAALSPADGAVQWARALGTSTPAIGTDESGRVHFAGSGTGPIDLGGGSLGTAVGSDVIIGVLQSTGEYEFARRFGGFERDVALQVQPTASGTVVAGFWSGTMTVDSEPFTSTDNRRDVFVFHFSTED